MGPCVMVVPGMVMVLLAGLASVSAHSSLLSPFARNAVDRDLPQWKGGHFGDGLHCAHPAGEQKDGWSFMQIHVVTQQCGGVVSANDAVPIYIRC